MIPPQKYLKSLVLRQGKGTGAPGDRCAEQEVRAWLGLDPSSDARPDCVCPVIYVLVVKINDLRPEWRAQLPEILPNTIGTNLGIDLALRRAYRCADWVTREVVPVGLRAAGRIVDAERFAGLEPIVGHLSAFNACCVLNALIASFGPNCSRIYYKNTQFRPVWDVLDMITGIDEQGSSIYNTAYAAHHADVSPIEFLKELCEMK